jgi:hypothetical protein
VADPLTETRNTASTGPDAGVSAPRRFSPRDLTVLAFTGAYMAAALVACILFRNLEFILYFVVMGLLIAIVAAVHRRAYLHIATRWALAVWGLAHMAGGLLPVPAAWPTSGDSHVLYNLWLVPGVLKYDQVVHGLGCGVVTWSCWQALCGAFRARQAAVQPTIGLVSLCMMAGVGFGAGNETVEFVATRVLPQTNVGGYTNTGLDLVANAIGSLTAAAMILTAAARDRRSQPSREGRSA